jgi:hypothetical protein
LPVLVISKKPHKTVRFHENPKKRSQVGFWAVILLLQFGIWVSRPRQMDGRDLGFRTSTDGQKGFGFQDFDRQTMQLIYMRFWLFQKNLTELPSFTKTRKRGAR